MDEITKKSVFLKSDINNNKKPPAGMLVTESPDWDAPKPQFPIQTNTQSWKKTGNQGQINHHHF